MSWTAAFLIVAILVLLAITYTAGQMWNPRLRRRRHEYQDRMAHMGAERASDRSNRPPDDGGHQGSFTQPNPAE